MCHVHIEITIKSSASLCALPHCFELPLYYMQHTELKRVYSDSRQTGTAASATLPAVTPYSLSE